LRDDGVARTDSLDDISNVTVFHVDMNEDDDELFRIHAL